MTKEKEDRVDCVLRNLFLLYADIYYSKIKDNFISAAKKTAKEKYGIELTHELEMLLKAAYEIGFVDSMFSGVDPDED